jgi:hypothetical protein
MTREEPFPAAEGPVDALLVLVEGSIEAIPLGNRDRRVFGIAHDVKHPR